MTTVRPLQSDDFEAWLPLWNGYLEFYETEVDASITRRTFERLVDPSTSMHGAVAVAESGELIGFVNWLTHLGSWSTQDYCYLEDLFVGESARGTGAGRALIQFVDDWGKANNVAKVYWLTAETNKKAQLLYDRMAKKTGFIHYQIG